MKARISASQNFLEELRMTITVVLQLCYENKNFFSNFKLLSAGKDWYSVATYLIEWLSFSSQQIDLFWELLEMWRVEMIEKQSKDPVSVSPNLHPTSGLAHSNASGLLVLKPGCHPWSLIFPSSFLLLLFFILSLPHPNTKYSLSFTEDSHCW